MEGFNLDFSDSDEDAKEKLASGDSQRVRDYQPKVLTDGWFIRADPLESECPMTVLKLRADLQYFEARYEGAFANYAAALDLLPLSNLTVRKDITESMARCLSMLGRQADALKVAHKLLDGCTNDDQVLAYYNLLLDIFSNPPAATTASEAGGATLDDSYRYALQNCLLLNPLCDRLWRDLAKLYSRLGRDQRSTACLLTAQHIKTVLAAQEANREDSHHQRDSHHQTSADAGAPKAAVAAKSLALVSFHGNYRNLPYACRLSPRAFNFQEADAGFDRKRLDAGGNEALFDGIYFTGHNGALLTQLTGLANS